MYSELLKIFMGRMLYSGRSSGNGNALYCESAGRKGKRLTYVGHAKGQRGYFSGSTSTAASSQKSATRPLECP